MTRLYSMRMQTVSNKIVLKNRYNTLEIEENGRRAWINGVMFWLKPCKVGAGLGDSKNRFPVWIDRFCVHTCPSAHLGGGD